MPQNNHARAQKLVESFRNELSDSVQSEIGERSFEKLSLMINELIQEDRREMVVLAEQIIATSLADVVIIGREFLSDPHWPLHAAQKLQVDMPWPNQ